MEQSGKTEGGGRCRESDKRVRDSRDLGQLPQDQETSSPASGTDGGGGEEVNEVEEQNRLDNQRKMANYGFTKCSMED